MSPSDFESGQLCHLQHAQPIPIFTPANVHEKYRKQSHQVYVSTHPLPPLFNPPLYSSVKEHH
jgi:hypothetical protein